MTNTATSAPEEEEEEEDVDIEGKGHRRTPFNINRVVIGANASFAAVQEDNEEECARQAAVQ